MPALLEHRVVAQMRVAMDDALVGEGIPPSAEHGARDGVAVLECVLPIVGELAALEPAHGQEPFRRQCALDLRYPDQRIVPEDRRVEPHVRGLALVVELLAQALRDLDQHLARLDGGFHALVDLEDDLELGEIGFHRR